MNKLHSIATAQGAPAPKNPAIAETDLARVSDTFSRMRLMMGKRVFGRAAIAKTMPDLEVMHLDVLDAMRRIEGEITVGAIAEALRIDPSRGSRLVSDLVSRGVLQRVASQEDGRRSLLERTELGDRLLMEVRIVKRSVLTSVLEDWPAEDIENFSLLFEKFVTGFYDATAALTATRDEQPD